VIFDTLKSFSSDSMRKLADQIERELLSREQAHCAIYEHELQRLWRLDRKDREAMIAQFAEEYGFRLRFYKKDCAQSSIDGHGGTSRKVRRIRR
jgi:hypothetical protein